MLRTARAGSAEGTWPERQRQWLGARGAKAEATLSPLLPAHTPTAARPASTPKGGPLHNPAPRGAFARRPGRPPSRAPGWGAGAPDTWLPGVRAREAAVLISPPRACEWRRRARRAERPRRWAWRQRGLAGGRPCSARPPWPSGPASSTLGVVAAPPLSAARCELAPVPVWLSARVSSVRPLGAGAAAAARSAAAGGGGGGLAGWGRRPGRGHREEVSVSGRLLLSPFFAPASLWR
uniref:translation initiation factor IF-2-like n=1 Tax=Arvicanthis niloticus TaxID=61156 RepID=UPI00148738CE|nr:translation initiation factor IF-2-like [Arvicanthis niloticus]